MRTILGYPLGDAQAALWFLGQAGYVLRDRHTCLVIDPYLTDSVAKAAPDLTRLVPVPIEPQDLKADLFVVTHDHLDHLDPETIGRYRHQETTIFVAPHLSCRKLGSLGIPGGNVICVDRGAEAVVRGVRIRGVFAVPTDRSVSDTTGYRVEFPNGRSVYHTSDTAFSEELLAAALAAEVLLVCINGKWGNLNAQDAARLAARVRPKVAIPNHYDMMRPNTEDPAAFVASLREESPDTEARVLDVLEPFVW
jgi:L-ascorbate 6-phosphate lactonase